MGRPLARVALAWLGLSCLVSAPAWSQEAFPPGPGDLIVTEFWYHVPPGAELGLVTSNERWLELCNVSERTLELEGVEVSGWRGEYEDHGNLEPTVARIGESVLLAPMESIVLILGVGLEDLPASWNAGTYLWDPGFYVRADGVLIDAVEVAAGPDDWSYDGWPVDPDYRGELPDDPLRSTALDRKHYDAGANDDPRNWCLAHHDWIVEGFPGMLGTPGAPNTACCVDGDRDGFNYCGLDGLVDTDPEHEDCDDLNPDTYPGAPEVCDGLDNDCDGALSDVEVDADGDGWMPCDADCDDADPAVFLHAHENCEDGRDNDCDELVDLDDPDCDVTLDGPPESTLECECRHGRAAPAPAGLLVLGLLAAALALRAGRRSR